MRLRIAVLEELLEEARQALANAGGVAGRRVPSGFDAMVEDLRRKEREEKEAIEAAGIYPHVDYTWKERILQVVQAHGSPMTCKEIVAGYDRAFPDSWASNLYNSVSVTISKLARSGALTRVPRPGVAGAAYAVPGQHNTYINPSYLKTCLKKSSPHRHQRWKTSSNRLTTLDSPSNSAPPRMTTGCSSGSRSKERPDWTRPPG
jgi:hypothetical protein